MSQPVILAIETSGRQGSVALACGSTLLAESGFATDREHARELLPTLDDLCRRQGLRPNDLRHCYLSIGPGSFTGLRVAVTFARHLALATGVRIVAVPTLDVIAENCTEMESPPLRVAAVLDAKRSQVFAAVYERIAALFPPSPATITSPQAGGAADAAGQSTAYRRVVEPCLIEPALLLASVAKPLAVIGEGIDYHRAAIEGPELDVLERAWWFPRARHVHRLGWRMALANGFTPPRDLIPFYLRRPEAEELWEKRHGPRP